MSLPHFPAFKRSVAQVGMRALVMWNAAIEKRALMPSRTFTWPVATRSMHRLIEAMLERIDFFDGLLLRSSVGGAVFCGTLDSCGNICVSVGDASFCLYVLVVVGVLLLDIAQGCRA